MLNPTGSGLTELQFSPVFGGAGKDAIPGIKVLSHRLQIDVFGRLGLNFSRFNCIYGKASNAPAQVAPCIYVPVVTVVNKLLWRDSSLQSLARQSVVMSNLNFFAFKGGFGDDLKSRKREATLPSTDRADPLRELLRVQTLIAENVVKPFAQWLQFRPQQSGVKLLNHALNSHEREQFVLCEPKAGQLRRVLRCVESIAAKIAVKDDWGPKPVPQLCKVSLESGRRNFKGGQYVLARYRATVAEQGLVPV